MTGKNAKNTGTYTNTSLVKNVYSFQCKMQQMKDLILKFEQQCM